MTLVDTSVWIEVLRRGARTRLGDHVDIESVVTCLPVVQEVLQGIPDERPFRIARESLLALPCIEAPLGAEAYLAAADLYRLARRAGRTVRSSVDCLIAACALRADVEVLHRDRDFAALAAISTLRQRSIG